MIWFDIFAVRQTCFLRWASSIPENEITILNMLDIELCPTSSCIRLRMLLPSICFSGLVPPSSPKLSRLNSSRWFLISQLFPEPSIFQHLPTLLFGIFSPAACGGVAVLMPRKPDGVTHLQITIVTWQGEFYFIVDMLKPCWSRWNAYWQHSTAACFEGWDWAANVEPRRCWRRPTGQWHPRV